MAQQRDERKPKMWYCPTCQEPIGKVIFGQLYLEGDVVANTDGPNLVVKCGSCGGRKVWFASDRLSQILAELADSIAKKIADYSAK